MKMDNKHIQELISKMTLDQKIGATLTLGFAGAVPKQNIYDYITKYHCGGLRLSCEARTFGNYVDPKNKKTIVSVESDSGIKYPQIPPIPDVRQYKAVLNELQQIARSRPLSLPLHFSYDQEGGTSSDFYFGNVNLFTKPMGIRATNDPQYAYKVAKAVSKQSRAVGFNWVHSPVLDINSNPSNPEIYTRAFSDRVDEVIEYTIENCKGFKDGGLIATGKHFPGRGDSDVDAHFEVPVINIDKKTMLERELAPYRILIEKDLLPSIMLAHSIFPAFDNENIATVSKAIITDLLREELGFDGVITTDSMTMGALATKYGVANACALSLEAGADLVLMKAENDLVEDTFSTIKSFVESGRISEKDLDKKVYRILNLKYEYGLFENEYDQIDPFEIINDKQITQLANEVAEKSVLVARNEDDILPLDSKSNILIVEQKIKNYNTFNWHSGILFENCIKYNSELKYLETSYSYDEQDINRINEKANNADTIIFTSYFLRGNLSNRDFIENFIKNNSDKKIIVVSNTPYEEISIPRNSKNVIVTFATSPENIGVVSKTLFGKIQPKGVWPLSKKLGESHNV